MQRIINYPITSACSGQTIQQFLKAKGYSSSNVVALKKIPESILVDGTWRRVGDTLTEGQTLTIRYTETESSKTIVPVALPLSIVYEDDDILVVNKPADMPVHPSLHNYTNTLANALMYYFSQKGECFTFRCINRIDRDTTGLVLIAKHAISAGILSGQMQRREIRRTYYALVSPIPAQEKGLINAPIARQGDSIITREVNFETGEHAVTHYEMIARSSRYPCALLSLHLDTGRTHQIRVHMQYIGCPLVGDSLYGCRDISDATLLTRQALHSASLSFRHPITGQPLTFTCALPQDMRRLL